MPPNEENLETEGWKKLEIKLKDLAKKTEAVQDEIRKKTKELEALVAMLQQLKTQVEKNRRQ